MIDPRKSGRNSGAKRRKLKCQPQVVVGEVETRSRIEQSQPQARGRSLRLTVATRRQTLEEQRQFDAALDLSLTEMVRQEIARATSTL